MKLSEYKDKLIHDGPYRNVIGRCPLCNANIQDRTVTLYKELIEALYRVYRHCGEHLKHEFETKEIKHLLGKNEYARFGDLIRFGGIIYKPKDENGKSRKAWFGINMARARQFFMGEYKIPVQIVLNQITNEILDAKYVTIYDFPLLRDMIDKDGLYDYEKVIL